MTSWEYDHDLVLPTWVLLTESHKSEYSLTRLEAAASLVMRRRRRSFGAK